MNIEIERLPTIAVVKVTDGLVGGAAQGLVAEVKEVTDEGVEVTIVDLGASGKVDSQGIGALVQAYTAAVDRGSRNVVVMPSTFFERQDGVLVRPIDPIFETYESREEAIDAVLDLV